jgi:putative endonuclease
MYYDYVLVNENGLTYTGYTSDLKRRIAEHNASDGFTKISVDWKLCYYEAFLSKKDAVRRERALKNSSQARRWLKERIEDSLKLCGKS